jgi:hypothetical protein
MSDPSVPAFFLPVYPKHPDEDDVRDAFREKHWLPADMIPAEIPITQHLLGLAGCHSKSTPHVTILLERRLPDLIDILSHGRTHTSLLLAYLTAADAFRYVQGVNTCHSQGRTAHERAVFVDSSGALSLAPSIQRGFFGSIDLRLEANAEANAIKPIIVSQIMLNYKTRIISWAQGTSSRAPRVFLQPKSKFTHPSAAHVVRWLPLMLLAERLSNKLVPIWTDLHGHAANIAPLSYDPSPMFYQVVSAAHRHPGLLTQCDTAWDLD